MCRQTAACWQLTAGSDKGEGRRGGEEGVRQGRERKGVREERRRGGG